MGAVATSVQAVPALLNTRLENVIEPPTALVGPAAKVPQPDPCNVTGAVPGSPERLTVTENGWFTAALVGAIIDSEHEPVTVVDCVAPVGAKPAPAKP